MIDINSKIIIIDTGLFSVLIKQSIFCLNDLEINDFVIVHQLGVLVFYLSFMHGFVWFLPCNCSYFNMYIKLCRPTSQSNNKKQNKTQLIK